MGGFDTIIATIISLAIIMFVTHVYIYGSNFLIENNILEYKNIIDNSIKIMNTRLNITNITYLSSALEIIADVENVGESKFSNLSQFDVFLYGNVSILSNTYYPTISGVDAYIISEIINPGLYDPHEIARFEIFLTDQLPNGTYVLVICTPNGVCSSRDFLVGG